MQGSIFLKVKAELYPSWADLFEEMCRFHNLCHTAVDVTLGDYNVLIMLEKPTKNTWNPSHDASH